jgi:parvulin-like peptidyl-prolyl isomerase
MQLSREYTQDKLEKKIESIKGDLLEKLIEDKLILQEAKKNDSNIEIRPGLSVSIKADESKVKARVAEIKKHYSSDGEFQEALLKQGLVQADIEQKIREQLLMSNIIEYRVRNKITVKPEEVTNFYDKNLKEFITPEERGLDCFVLTDKSLASAFAFDLSSGKKLEDLAARYPFTVNRIKAKKGGELKKEIEDVISKLGIDEISQPVALENKYYVFKLINIIPSRQLILPEVQDKIYSFLYENQLREKLSEWLAELKARSYIKITQD